MSKGLRRRVWIGALPVLLAACASSGLPKPQVWRQQVTVAAEHSGSNIELDRDQELVVRLTTPSNSPFEWSLVDLPRSVLAAPAAAKFEREASATNFNAAVGDEVWRFKAAAAGSVTLRFELRRPHSVDPALRSVTYSVTVR